MAADDQTQQADEWCLVLLVPADLPVPELRVVRQRVSAHLARCTAQLALPPGCAVELSWPAGPAP
ncbi:MAG TPA: hypothetical protein VMZ11_08555 [Mycobacteriales bacterium]|nr:hypothetical protein [Mycobacteriales bacterium]